MKKSARKSRIFALEVCYQLDVLNSMNEEAAHRILEEKNLDEEVYSRVSTLVLGVIKNLSYIDGLLSRYSTNWDISRMSYVDRNILRIAIYEMVFVPDVPDIVVIDEAIEISKIYSTPDSGKFINGILDTIRKEVVLKNS